MMHLTDSATDFSTGLGALISLCDGFLDETQVREAATPVAADALPSPFDNLLVHHDHMTTMLAAHHGRPVALDVLERTHEANDYARRIVLTLKGTPIVVEFGIVRLNLGPIAPDAREEILAGDTPLGDILIRHDIMRRIDPKWYFRFPTNSCFGAAFSPPPKGDLFGRLGVIHCNGQPVIKLLEVVADVRVGGG